MRKIISIILFLVTSFINVPAQMTSPIRVKAGEDLYLKLAKEIYLYPSFTRGIIFFRDGRMSQSNFNYNFLNGELQFITDKGDTLSVANELTIKSVAIANDSFYYNDGYLKLVAGNQVGKVVRKEIIKIIDQQKIGAYDQPNSAGSVVSFSSMFGNFRNIKLDVTQDVILGKQTTFYFADQYNHFFRANKKSLLTAFHKKENELNEYFKKNDVNFNKEEDLIKLIAVLAP